MKRRMRPITTLGCISLAVSVGIFAALGGARAAEPLQAAYRLMAHGEFEQAIAELEQRLAETAETDEELRAEMTFLLARAHESLGDWGAAMLGYRIVAHEFPGSECCANACLALAQLHVRQGRPDKAAAALEAAIGTGLTPEHELRAQLYLAETISIPGTEVEDVDRALDLFEALDEKVRKPVDIARLNYGLGFCHQRKGNWQQAERAYVAVAEAAPNSPWTMYARMQRIAYYRQRRLNQDAARIERQLRQHGLAVTALARVEPRVPDFLRSVEEADATGQGEESQLPKNAVFAYKDYRVKADNFSVRSPDRVLIGRGNVSLVQNTKGAGMKIQAATVRIDLRRLHADFSGSVSFETMPKQPGAEPRRIADLAQLIINLKTGWFRVRSAESPD